MMGEAITADSFAWPAVRPEHRPWTRWWWMGSAVDAPELTRQLRALRRAGFGGVEISPIYGVKGEESRHLAYLSPQWLAMLGHARREARALDMGADIILGTGWPYGGPWVQTEDSAAKVLFETFDVDARRRVERAIVSAESPGAHLVALVATSATGEAIDLMARVDGQRRLDWAAPAGEWRLEAVFQAGTGQKVKRAAPGGEGVVVDHFSIRAIRRYLDRFEEAFSALKAEEKPRALFNDSWEVYGANWSDGLLDHFRARRGYDLRHQLRSLRGEGEEDRIRRVRYDYRITIAEMELENFVRPWTAFAHAHGAMTRNQAHGSPGNLLDLYAAADIPETEVFGTVCLAAAGTAPLAPVPREFDRTGELLACRLASSAAHVAGRPLCSCESFTWLGEHFLIPLEHLRVELDMVFTRGINHVVYQGTPYSPADAPWPGWLFYASTHAGPTNPLWRDIAAVNEYIARCQSFLQEGRIDNDVLVYLPIHDLWSSKHGVRNHLHYMGVHYVDDWLDRNMPGLSKAMRWLERAGYGFDCISDALLDEAIEVEDGRLVARGGSYRMLLVPSCEYLPPTTARRLLDLARRGATVALVAPVADDVPGLIDLDGRRAELRQLLAEMSRQRGVVMGDLETVVAKAGIRREALVDHGLEFIRRATDRGPVYFIANWRGRAFEGWMPLAVGASSVILFDPASGGCGRGAIRGEKAQREVYLQLDVGQSIILRCLSDEVKGPRWHYVVPAGAGSELTGPWGVEFVEGGPTLPRPRTVRSLSSWTAWKDEDAEMLQAFSGTARYTMRFDRPEIEADAWALELGEVLHSASVVLNRAPVATLYSRPWRAVITAPLRERGNELTIEVTNLMANRIAHMERSGMPWRRFFFVNIHYDQDARFDFPPQPSGLIGPVRLLPLSTLKLP